MLRAIPGPNGPSQLVLMMINPSADDPYAPTEQAIIDVIAQMQAGSGLSREPMRFEVQGAITANFFLGTATQQNASAKVSKPIAVAGIYTTIRLRTATAPGGGGLTYTVFKNDVATGITVLQAAGATTALATLPLGVSFAAGDTMSVQMTGDGTPSSPEVVVI